METPQTGAQSARGKQRHMRRIIFWGCILIGICAAALLAGLVFFTGHVLLSKSSMPEKADAIVVVTGGQGRLDQAVHLFKKGYGKKLLISGVHPDYSHRTLRSKLGLTKKQVECCIELDRRALNTVANATQTADWAKRNTFTSLILVTSAYHMPRTLLEMRRAAPDISFQAAKVTPSVERSFIARLFDPNNMQLLTKEYGKLLAAIFHGTSERLHKTKN